MSYLNDKFCRKCGEVCKLRYVKSSGMDIEPTGMFSDCPRCGFSEIVKSLDEKENYQSIKER